MRRSTTTGTVGLALLLALALGVGGCGSEDDDPDAARDSGSSASAESDQPAADDGPPFGPECQDLLAAWDEESTADLSERPYADLLIMRGMRRSNGFFGQAGLLDREDVTLFVPADSAINGLSVEELEPLLLDRGHIKRVMSGHVVPGRLPPSELAGEHTTVGGDPLTIEVSGDEVRVGDVGALVTCGNIQTLDATVYLIDDVLVS